MSSETKNIIKIIDRKWEKLSSTKNEQFYRHFRRLWEYVRNNPLSNEIIEQILFKRDHPLFIERELKSASDADADALLKGNWTYFDKNVGGEERDIALFIRLMDKIAGPKWVKEINESKKRESWADVMYNIAITYVNPDNKDRYHSISLFLSLFLVPVLEYIKDNLDKNVLVLDVLKKFKQKSEWFNKTEMYKIYDENQGTGEDKLKKYLYEYLFNQDIPFLVEPSSPSGKIDFLLQQSGEDRIGCEAKVYKGNNKPYIIHGIQTQLPTYLQEHNLSVGYMVIFKVSQRKLLINLEIEQGLNYVDIGSKRIFIIVVDVFMTTPASKKAKADERKPLSISKEDFSL